MNEHNNSNAHLEVKLHYQLSQCMTLNTETP